MHRRITNKGFMTSFKRWSGKKQREALGSFWISQRRGVSEHEPYLPGRDLRLKQFVCLFVFLETRNLQERAKKRAF